MRNIEFIPAAFREYQVWIETDRKVAMRIGDLIRNILRDPYKGIGKPEALKHREHRLIYSINETSIVIISCYSHY
jgi:toxin YoeB